MKQSVINVIPSVTKKLFQRVVIVCICILAQLGYFLLVIWKFQEQNQWIYLALTVLSILVGLAVITKNTNPAYKIAWIIPILAFPVFGGLFYIILGGNG